MKLVLVLIIVIFGAICQARHLRPCLHHGNFDPDEILIEKVNNENPKMSNDYIFRYLTPSRFVPLNSEKFFKSIEPCEDGFQRDVLGICREVWD